jgi:hypothetical protein
MIEVGAAISTLTLLVAPGLARASPSDYLQRSCMLIRNESDATMSIQEGMLNPAFHKPISWWYSIRLQCNLELLNPSNTHISRPPLHEVVQVLLCSHT